MKKVFASVIVSIALLVIIGQCREGEDPVVHDPLVIELIPRDATTFQGADGFVGLFVAGGVPPYKYKWSNGMTTKNITGLKAGIYSVVVKDAVDSVATGSATVSQPVPDSVVIDIQGNIYSTVKIGSQTWMKQNLRVRVAPDSSAITSYVYNNDEGNAGTFGRLYTWDVAMNGSAKESARGICPVGWHIPSDEEWKILEMYLGMTRQEADISNDWRGQGVGIKLRKGGESGYDALYAGRRTSNGTFSLLNQYEYIWTSTESGQDAWRRCLDSGLSTVGRYNTFPKTYAFSIRCVKDK